MRVCCLSLSPSLSPSLSHHLSLQPSTRVIGKVGRWRDGVRGGRGGRGGGVCVREVLTPAHPYTTVRKACEQRDKLAVAE
jgi:hypothetical protein